MCLSEGNEASRYRVRGSDGRSRPVVAIDYVNDQCDVDVQSRWLGAPPDAIVRKVAERFAAAAWQCRGGQRRAGTLENVATSDTPRLHRAAAISS